MQLLVNPLVEKQHGKSIIISRNKLRVKYLCFTTDVLEEQKKIFNYNLKETFPEKESVVFTTTDSFFNYFLDNKQYFLKEGFLSKFSLIILEDIDLIDNFRNCILDFLIFSNLQNFRTPFLVLTTFGDYIPGYIPFHFTDKNTFSNLDKESVKEKLSFIQTKNRKDIKDKALEELSRTESKKVIVLTEDDEDTKLFTRKLQGNKVYSLYQKSNFNLIEVLN